MATEDPSMKSEELFERSKKVAPGGVHSPVRSFKGLDRSPVFFQSAKGAYLTSVDGKNYIDFCQSFGPLILGHRDDDVQNEVLKMINTAWSFGACEPYSLELAEWLTQNISFAQKVRFVSSGTEATMSAIRLARAFTHKSKILKFDGCYHGHVDSLLVKAGSGLAGVTSSSSAGVPEAIAQTTVVAKLDDEQEFEKVFNTHLSDLAAVIMEPLPANYGLLVQRKEFLNQISALCRKNNVLLIFDEVISGFRVGLGGMAELLDLKPDLVCYGKIIGGGFPVGCYAGRSEIMDMVAPLGPVYQAGTLSANPVGMRAGLVSLSKMKDLNGWEKLNKTSEKFCKSLNEIVSKIDLTVIQQSSLFWIHQQTGQPIRKLEQIPSNQSETFRKLFLECLDLGLYLAPNAYEVGFLSLAHRDNILDQSLEIFKKAVNKL
jgi:glutamate-1-semialdehyde 2,1-aminomutase